LRIRHLVVQVVADVDRIHDDLHAAGRSRRDDTGVEVAFLGGDDRDARADHGQREGTVRGGRGPMRAGLQGDQGIRDRGQGRRIQYESGHLRSDGCYE
jgi:hypothetical protein